MIKAECTKKFLHLCRLFRMWSCNCLMTVTRKSTNQPLEGVAIGISTSFRSRLLSCSFFFPSLLVLTCKNTYNGFEMGQMVISISYLLLRGILGRISDECNAVYISTKWKVFEVHCQLSMQCHSKMEGTHLIAFHCNLFVSFLVEVNANVLCQYS